MAVSVDDALNLSVMITRGDRGWLVSMATQGDARGSNVDDYEFADMRWDKSLAETEDPGDGRARRTRVRYPGALAYH